MSRSVLLHALSLNDRILEPNHLPLCGHVWAFDKLTMSHEMFVGNCISMLSLLGSQNASIVWENDIMAFDVQLGGQAATVIISLQDDSLASDYYYFLGIWVAADEVAGAGEWLDPDDWEREGLLAPAISYEVIVADKPLQLPQVKKIVGADPFAENICHSAFRLYGCTEVTPRLSGRFVMCPAMHASNHGRFEVRHALYSLRNLMALAGCAMKMHDQVLENSLSHRLAQDIEKLQGLLAREQIDAAEWAAMVREGGRIALLAASEEMVHQKMRPDARNLFRLFESIEAELDISDMSGMPSLSARMRMPFEYASELIEEKLAVLSGLDKQSGILQLQINNCILVTQQLALERLLASA
ncbi:hypothetical protein FE236_12560 [Mariprofundus erugo]|uniref:hypothetical protein n=1 Tax=Mariprofundus erugo TaxID=2528639 RepID=UPI0010FE60B5|nr:hypothetical protein [Mariprofundus erugo]TLS73969.1 hypothetical protein FE236_12560 [Mariprofundus erugo]